MRVRCIFFKVKINKRVVIDYKKSLMNMNKIFISWAETNQVFCFYDISSSIPSLLSFARIIVTKIIGIYAICMNHVRNHVKVLNGRVCAPYLSEHTSNNWKN